MLAVFICTSKAQCCTDNHPIRNENGYNNYGTQLVNITAEVHNKIILSSFQS